MEEGRGMREGVAVFVLKRAWEGFWFPPFRFLPCQGGMSLFKSEGPAAKRPFGQTVTGGSAGSGGQGAGMSREALDELIIRTAQVTSVHDIELRELKTMYRRVTVGANSGYGTVLREVDEAWKRDRGAGRPLGASKHVRLAVALLGKIHEDPKTSGEVKTKLEEVFGNVDGSRDEGVAQWLQVVKWRTFKGDREGILEFKLVPELGTVEGEIVRVLTEHGGKVKTTPEPKGPMVRRVDELLEGTWRK